MQTKCRLLIKLNIAVDFSVRTNFHVHFLFSCDKCFSISTPLRSQLSQTSSPSPRLSSNTDATLPLSSLRYNILMVSPLMWQCYLLDNSCPSWAISCVYGSLCEVQQTPADQPLFESSFTSSQNHPVCAFIRLCSSKYKLISLSVCLFHQVSENGSQF